MNHMQQVGLVPAKKRKEEIVSIPSDEEVPFYFQRRLEDLEKEVRQLQNKNRALEESYKKLSNLVEAQNHLLASGGPMLQRMPTPACTAPQTREDCVSIADIQPTDRKVIATASIPSYVTSQSFTQSSKLARMQSTSPSVTKQNGVTAFELPRRVSAKEVLHLWEYGCDEFPPLKDWTPTQKLKQQSKISRWKKLVDIFQNGYGGDWDRFERSFSGNKGEVLPVTTILSLFETQQTPAFLSASTLKENGVHSPIRIKAEEEEDKITSRQHLHSDVESEVSDVSTENLEPRSVEQLPKEGNSAKLDSQSEVRYTLPRKVTPRDIVSLWENGCEDFPPVGMWSRAQKIGQETKIFRWKKVVDIFNGDCHRNWDLFDRKYTNEKSLPLPISSIIAKYDAEHVVHGPIFDTKEPRRNSIIAGFGSSSSFGETENETVIVKTDQTMGPVEVKIEIPNLGDSDDVFSLGTGDSAFGSQESLGQCTLITTEASTTEYHNGIHLKAQRESCTSPRDDKYILPRNVTAKDVIKMWEEGYEDMPPLSTWSPAQKAGQRSKFSRWAKIYDIYKYHYKGDMDDFERAFSDEKGELIPVTTIVAKHDARDTSASNASSISFSSPSMVVQSSTDGPELEIYQLPRKVSAKDVVELWEEGCERFPPVSKWPKIHRVGHETKLFRWKKIVDIFRKDCSGSWEKFEERFCNSKGELLPISAILAKYDLENEPVSYFKPLNLNGSVRHSVDKPGPTMADTPQLSSNLPESTEGNAIPTDTFLPKTASTPALAKQPEFILPKKVSALDVIYLWENGLDDMPPVCQWTSPQKASQRSKISRWNKIVDIFKYECCSDIRLFEEKYKDERGELMPITTILNLHDAQDKPWEME